MFDAHTHLHDVRLASCAGQVVEEACRVGVRGFGLCGTSPQDWGCVARMASAYRVVHPSFGVHPWYCVALAPDWLDRLEEMLKSHPGASVGEIGLDALGRGPDPAVQVRVFTAQLELAVRLNRPVVLHAVRCVPAVLDAVRACPRARPRFLIHGFAGSAEMLRDAERLGGCVSFGGTLMNPRARRVRAAACAVAAERLLAETDAPDMPFAGGRSCLDDEKLNHPANLERIVGALATCRGIDFAQASELTEINARRFFGLPSQ